MATVHTLGDGDNMMIGVRLAGAQELGVVVCIDHNLGTVVKDAFVIPEPLAELIELMRTITDDPDTTCDDIDRADARARIADAIDAGAITFPPFEADTRPACRPLVEWAMHLLHEGDHGYERPDWDEATLDAIAGRIFDSPFAADLGALDDHPLPDEPFSWSDIPADVHERVGEVLALVDRCRDEMLEFEHRTACRRSLARVAAGNPEVFRRRASLHRLRDQTRSVPAMGT